MEDAQFSGKPVWIEGREQLATYRAPTYTYQLKIITKPQIQIDAAKLAKLNRF